MHTVSNQVEIPIESVERILTARAVPDFTGTVEIRVRVLPTAGHEVEFEAVATRSIAPANRTEEREQPIVTNERVAKVRRTLAENASAFVIGTKLIAIEASFLKGDLRGFKITEREIPRRNEEMHASATRAAGS